MEMGLAYRKSTSQQLPFSICLFVGRRRTQGSVNPLAIDAVVFTFATRRFLNLLVVLAGLIAGRNIRGAFSGGLGGGRGKVFSASRKAVAVVYTLV